MSAVYPPLSCPGCGAENRGDRHFCHACGAALAVACPGCGFVNDPGARFCGGCGHVVDSGAGARDPAVAASVDAPSVGEPWDASGAETGERKQVTVLFADLKSSLELLADRDPEDARKLLDSVLELMIGAAHAYEGTVNQVMGDGIMALFGAPVSFEDHAVRACYAALRMHAEIERFGEELRRSYGSDVRIRIGLNSGEVVVRSIRTDAHHMDYSAIGQTTHLAGRMEQLAEPGRTLVTAATARLVEGYVTVKRLGFIPVRGMRAPVEVFELADRLRGRSRFQATAGRGLTRFVGRERELAQLQAAWEQVASEAGRVVALVGEPGVGKSRLVWEFTHGRRDAGWLLLEAAGVSYGKNVAYMPVLELLQTYFQIDERLAPERRRDKIIARLQSLGAAVEDARAEFLELFDVLDERRRGAPTPAQRRLRLLNAIKQLFLAEARIQHVCLVVEDLQWADSETATLLTSLVDSLPSARILLLVSHRPEFEPGWGDRPDAITLVLDPFPRPTAQRMLDDLLGGDPSVAALKTLLIDRAEGNPFFLEESVDDLVETQALAGERGTYRLTHALSAVQVPATVRALLAARIDRRSPLEKQILETAAVVVKDVPAPLLARVVGCSEAALREELGNLQRADLLRQSRVFPEAEYTFKHALTQEVAYNGLVHERRRLLHVKIAQTIEELYPDRLTEHIDRLAHHALRGELWDKALRFCREAGARAFLRSAHRAAATYFEDALLALRSLPETAQRKEYALDLLLDLRYALIPLGEFARILECLREAEGLARAVGDQRRLGLVLSFLMNYFHVIGDLDRTLEHGRQALEIAQATGDPALRAIATAYLGQAYHTLGAYPEAIELARENIASLEGDLRHERLGMALPPSVYSRFTLVCSLGEIGEFREGIVIGHEGIRIADVVDHPYSRIFAYLALGTLYMRKGDVDDAVRLLEPTLELCSAADVPILISLIAGPLGSAYALSGRLTEAVRLLERAIEQAVSTGYTLGHSMRIGGLAEAYLQAGRVEEASTLVQRALDLAATLKARGYEAWALRLSGDTLACLNPPDVEAALDAYRRAITLAGRLHMRPLQAQCRLRLGVLLDRVGHRAAAAAEIRTAVEMLQAMGMLKVLERATADHPELVSAGR